MRAPETVAPGQKIRDLRTQAKLTQSQLADATGIKKSTIHAWEAGTNQLAITKAKHAAAVSAIAGAIGCTPEDIWGPRHEAPAYGAPELITPLEFRPIRVRGSIPCRNLDLYSIEQITWRLPQGIQANGWFCLRYSGSLMEPLICHGDIVLVQPRDTLTDGLISVIQTQEGMDVSVLRFSSEGWMSCRIAYGSEAFAGEVLGVVSGILRVRSQAAYLAVFSAAGLHFEQVPVLGTLDSKSFGNT